MLSHAKMVLLLSLGKPMPIDLFSVTQDGKRSLSFFSQCMGLMAELDLWTEHLRFMGSKYVPISRSKYSTPRPTDNFVVVSSMATSVVSSNANPVQSRSKSKLANPTSKPCTLNSKKVVKQLCQSPGPKPLPMEMGMEMPMDTLNRMGTRTQGRFLLVSPL